MSRIGKKAVPVPAGVTAAIEGKTLTVKGAKGTLTLELADEVKYAVEDGRRRPFGACSARWCRTW